MQISVRVNGTLARGIGLTRFPAELPEPATGLDLIQWLEDEYPSLAPEIGKSVMVIDGQHQSRSASLSDGQEVSLLIPISGG